MSHEGELITAELFKADQEHDLALTVKGNGGELWIRCPFHGDGRESSPSLRITIDDSSSFFQKCKCYGCGWGVKHYNELAEHFGLMKTDKNFKAVGVRGLGFRKKMQKKQAQDEGRDFKLSTFDWPKDREWRSIPGKTVLRNGGVLTDTRHDLEEPRLAFPVKVWGETKGFIYAMLRAPNKDLKGKKLEVAYINSSGPWKEQCVFGFDRARRLLKRHPDYPLWIVEGPRDRLHIEAAGGIAVSTLGSTFSDGKCELIKILNPHRILVATDNDEAGNKLAEEINEYLDRHLELTRIKWKQGQDPCDVSRKRIAQINERFIYQEAA